jgi:hypothetical protein
MKKRAMVGLACVAIAGLSGAAPPEPTADEFTRTAWLLVNRLSGPDDVAANEAISAFRRIHELLVPELLKIADSEPPKEFTWNDRRMPAVRLLAELHAPEAIPILVRRIDAGHVAAIEQPLPLGRYPYAMALVTYKQAAVPEILSFLRRTGDEPLSDRSIELYAHALKSCAGRQWAHEENVAEAISIVEREIATSAVHEERELKRVLVHLQGVAKRLQRLRETYPPSSECDD